MRKIKFIINPVAGKGDGKFFLETIHNKMEKSKLDYSITISSFKGNIEDIARQSVKEGYTDIIAVGGDGTVLETFNGIYNTNTILGIIPAGTGNDFFKMLGECKDLNENLDKIIVGNTKLVDIGCANNSYFLNEVGVGIDTEIIEETQKIKKIINGSASYVIATFKALAKYKCKDVSINIDGFVIKRKVFLVVIANGKYFGGGMKIAPGAEIDSEAFEIIVINKLSKFKFAILFKKVFSGDHVNEKAVEVFKGKSVVITSDMDHKINADGNILGSLPLNIQILPKAQKVIF